MMHKMVILSGTGLRLAPQTINVKLEIRNLLRAAHLHVYQLLIVDRKLTGHGCAVGCEYLGVFAS